MECPNPACRGEIFKVRVAWKQRMKELPMFLPVYLNCAKCGRQIKAYVLNEHLKEVHSVLRHLLEGQELLFERLKELRKEPRERKGFFERLKERI